MSSGEEKLEELEGKTSTIRVRQEELKRRIERWKAERNILNESVRNFRDEALKERGKRDNANREFAEVKKTLQNLHQELDKKFLTANRIDKELYEKRRTLPSKRKLEKQLEDIEWRLMTTPTIEIQDMEKNLVDRSRELRKAISEHDKLNSKEDERLISITNSKALKLEIRGKKERMKELREKSQKHHEKMLNLYEKVNEEKKLADVAHTKFIEAVSEMKEVDYEFSRVISEIRKISEKMKKANLEYEEKRRLEVEAKKIILLEGAKRKLEAGEKLSIEELKLIYEEKEEKKPG